MWGLDWVQQTARGFQQNITESAAIAPGREEIAKLTRLGPRAVSYSKPFSCWCPVAGGQRGWRATQAHSASGNQRLLWAHLHRDVVNPRYPGSSYCSGWADNRSNFFQINLRTVLPTVHQHVQIQIRGRNILDHVYTNTSGRYKALPHPHFGIPAQISLLLLPTYSQLINHQLKLWRYGQMKPQQPYRTVLTDTHHPPKRCNRGSEPPPMATALADGSVYSPVCGLNVVADGCTVCWWLTLFH